MNPTPWTCITCRKTHTGEPGRIMGGELRKRWCAPGTYITKTRRQCKACWKNDCEWLERSRQKSIEKNKEILREGLRKLEEK